MPTFPFNNWINELKILNKIGINKIEWLIDENFKENPVLNKKKHKEIIKQKNKYKIDIVSICCDNFMFNSFFDDKFSFKKLKQLINNCNILGIKQLDIPLLGKNSIKSFSIFKNKNGLRKVRISNARPIIIFISIIRKRRLLFVLKVAIHSGPLTITRNETNIIQIVKPSF